MQLDVRPFVSPLLLATTLATGVAPLTAQADVESAATTGVLRLRFATFDPLRDHEPSVPPLLRADENGGLWIVQAEPRQLPHVHAHLTAAGASIASYLPDDAYLVRTSAHVAFAASRADGVRWVGAYHPAYKLEPVLRFAVETTAARYRFVVVDDRAAETSLAAAVEQLGGIVDSTEPGSILFEATLTAEQLLAVAHRDEVLWIERWTPPGLDANNARIQGGADWVEALGGYTGSGLNGHVYEGIEATHPDLTTPATVVSSCPTATQHGHACAGIVFGNGTSAPSARGISPDVVPFYTNFTCVTPGRSRWQVVQDLVTIHDVSFTTSSWGRSRTSFYTSVSAESDDIVFDHDITWTQANGNSANPESRPESWGKNIITCGGIVHYDNADRTDDSWAAGGASTGPATDGRIKPDLVAYYDEVWTSDLTGPAGYAPGNSYPSFGGTSASTPMIAGHAALAIQMFTDSIFNNPPRVPGGTRFQNRPHASTLKAMLIANARQYVFTSSSTDNLRIHQGWGFPDVRTMYENRSTMLVVDESDVLTQGRATTWNVAVTAGEPELKVTLCWTDPAGNPGAVNALVNDLDLEVTAPDGTIYRGNVGLRDGNYSTPGGTRDSIDTVENVFVRRPAAGTWTVRVAATRIALDGHVQTPALDADYGLCVTNGTNSSDISTFGSGCPGSVAFPTTCSASNENLPNQGVGTAASTAYAVRFSAPASSGIEGFELKTRTPSIPGGSNPQTIQTTLYAAAPNGLPGAVLATGTMTVGPREDWYRTLFASPVAVAPGQSLFLGFRNTASFGIVSPRVLNGVTSPVYRDNGPGTAWISPPSLEAWSFRVLCASSTPTAPTADATGPAETGTFVDALLRDAAPGAPFALLVGDSDTTWPGGTLPFGLGAFGAPLCSLLVAPTVSGPGMVGGDGSARLNVLIPASPTLVGATAWQQFLIVDSAANALGLAFTNGVRITVGG